MSSRTDSSPVAADRPQRASSILPAPERERLLQRLDVAPPVVRVSWALAAVQVALGPLWFLWGLAYAQAYAARGVAIVLNSSLKDAGKNATGAFVGSPLYFLSCMTSLEGFVLEYLGTSARCSRGTSRSPG